MSIAVSLIMLQLYHRWVFRPCTFVELSVVLEVSHYAEIEDFQKLLTTSSV